MMGIWRPQQAGFPHFVLYEVLDIIHAERLDNVKAQFEETPTKREKYYSSMYIKEDDTLKAMSLVHRSWTFPVQKALGLILYIGKPVHEMDILLSPVKSLSSALGPPLSPYNSFHSLKKKKRKEKLSVTIVKLTCHRLSSSTNTIHMNVRLFISRKIIAFGSTTSIGFLLVSRASIDFTSNDTARSFQSGLVSCRRRSCVGIGI